MNITIFIPYDLHFPLAEGTRKQAWWTALALQRRGFHVTLLCYHPRKRFKRARTEAREGIRIVRTNRLIPPRMDCDILHIFGCPSIDWLPVLARTKYKQLFVSLFDGALCRYWTSLISKKIADRYLPKASTVFVQTRHQEKLLSEKTKKNVRIRVLPPLIPAFKKKSKPKRGTTKLLYMSHTSPVKGILEVISMFRTLARTQDIHLTIAQSGVTDNRQVERELRRLKREHPSQLTIKGKVNPQKELQENDIYLYPIRKTHNTFSVPLSLFESAQTGTPFISSALPPLQEYFGKEFLIHPKSSQDLKKKVEKFLKKRPDTRRALKRPLDNDETLRIIQEHYENTNA